MRKDFCRIIPAALCTAALLCPACRVAPEAAGPQAMPQDPRRELNELKEARFREAVSGLAFQESVVVVEPLAEGGHPASERHLRAGLDELAANKTTGALRSITLAVRADPGWAPPYDGLGKALLAKGKDELALAAFRTAVSRDPAYIDARFDLASTLSRLGRRDEAIAAMEEVVALDPGHAPAHERLAIWSWYAGDGEAARRHARAARELGHDLPPQFAEKIHQE